MMSLATVLALFATAAAQPVDTPQRGASVTATASVRIVEAGSTREGSRRIAAQESTVEGRVLIEFT